MKLAIHGGKPVREKLFPAYRTIGSEEKEAVNRVLDSGVLSNFLGAWHNHFYGGTEVKALEKEWADYFGVKHAISVNSCTSGLYCAVGATGVEPGQEIIVSPYTMSASATAPLIFNAIPIFSDIEEDYFCLDPKSVEAQITSRTKAIIVVDIFGLPYNVEAINSIAQKYGLDEQIWIKNIAHEWKLRDVILNHKDDKGVDDVRLKKQDDCEFILTPPKDQNANEDEYVLIGRGWVD